MRATDFIRANTDKDGKVSLEVAIEGAYMAQEDALASLRNQAAAKIMPVLVDAYYKDGQTNFYHLIDMEMRLKGKPAEDVIANVSVIYADALVKRLKED